MNKLDEFLSASDQLFNIYLGMAREITLTGTIGDVEKFAALTESYLEVLNSCCGKSLLRVAGALEYQQIQHYSNLLRNDFQDILLKMLQT